LSYRENVRPYLPQPGVIAQDIQAQLKQIGINVTLDVKETSALFDAQAKGQLSMQLIGWGADYPDATDFMDYHFGKGSPKFFGDHDPKLEDLISKAGQLSDPAARLALYKQANDELADFVPVVPVAFGANAHAFKAPITGAYGNPFSGIQFALLGKPGSGPLVWMQAGEPVGMYCNDESDGETLDICEQVNEALLSFKPGTGIVAPGVASLPTSNADATQYTFKLIPGIKFSDGTAVTANDAVLSWDVEWDASSPLHKGHTGTFDYFSGFFNGFLNPPPTATPAPPAATAAAPAAAPATKAATAAPTMAPTMSGTMGTGTPAATMAPTAS